MKYSVKPKELIRQEQATPQTIPQLIQKYKLDAMWDNIQKIVEEVVQQNSGYVVKKDGVMYITDSNELEDADTVLRIGKNFLEISNNGIEGDFQTIIGIDGVINANFVQSGEISADRIRGGTLRLGGVNNAEGEINVLDSAGKDLVVVNKEGIILKNGTKLIGDSGILNLFQFGEFNWKRVGYSTNYLPMSIGAYECINVPVFVPENFTITKAVVILYHSPIKYYYQDIGIWGYCRNLRLYKQEQANDYSEIVQLSSELFPENNLFGDEVVAAFGHDGFTAAVPSDNIHNVERVESIDIKDYLSTGKNIMLQVRSGNVIPPLEPDIDVYQTNYLSQTGNVKVVVHVTGFVK